MLTNDDRALLGVAAMEAADAQLTVLVAEHNLGPRIEDLVATSLEDTMVFLAHACDRFGLDPAEVMVDAYARYTRNLVKHPPAVYVGDGTQITTQEVHEYAESAHPE